MKRCINCQTTYTDDTLKYCLQDGGALVPLTLPLDPDATVIEQRPDDTPTLIWPASAPTASQAARATAPNNGATANNRPRPKTGFIVAGLAILVLGGGLAAYLFVSRERGPATPPPVVANNATPRPTPKPPVNKNTNANRPALPAATPTRAAGEVDFTITASSTRADFNGISYNAANLRDGLWETAWIEGDPGPGVGASLTCNFPRLINLRQVTITPGYFKSPSTWEKNNRLKKITLEFSDGSARQFPFDDDMRYVTLDVGPVKTKFVRLVINEVYNGTTDADDTAISDISFTTAK